MTTTVVVALAARSRARGQRSVYDAPKWPVRVGTEPAMSATMKTNVHKVICGGLGLGLFLWASAALAIDIPEFSAPGGSSQKCHDAIAGANTAADNYESAQFSYTSACQTDKERSSIRCANLKIVLDATRTGLCMAAMKADTECGTGFTNFNKVRALCNL